MHRSLPSFFFNDTATTEIYTLSLHDALPISSSPAPSRIWPCWRSRSSRSTSRSEEHTSELQSPCNLVCRLLLEKKKQTGSAPQKNCQLPWGLRLRGRLHTPPHYFRR